MEIIADDKLPLLPQLFAEDYQLTQLPSQAITPDTVKTADILLCRSVTKVNAELLADSKVKFIASATSGDDHIDKTWLAQNNIAWCAAAGCNAVSVAEYVICVVAALKKQGLLKGQRAGVIGAGHAGSAVVKNLQASGFDVIVNDPPRAERDPQFISIPLEHFTDLDLICLHPALTTDGNYPSYHMIDKTFLQQQRPQCVLLNAARGAIINTDDLKNFGQHLIWCLDVYENEPNIDLELIRQAAICTPHIAGHAIQSKWRGSEIVYHNTMRFLKIAAKQHITYPLPKPAITLPASITHWEDVVLTLYNPMTETELMKKSLLGNDVDIKVVFNQLRSNTPLRHEFSYLEITDQLT